MNTQEIKNILQDSYSRNNWLRFLVFISNEHSDRLKDTLHPQDLSHLFKSTSYPISSLTKIGTYHTSDKQTIPIYEVSIKNNIRIERNRVGVNQFIKNVVLKQQGTKAALCVFKNENNSNIEWRFSFVSKFAASQFFSDILAKETQPKRYTYIYGTNEEHRTAIQCFQNLKNSNFTVQDFFDAFSVEKVSKDFFDGYKDLYKTLVQEISSIPSNYTTVFNNKDKDVRDFSKRLLGRIVFLYFLQKKYWLGSTTLKYKDGDPDFLFTLFNESKCTEDGSDYYLHKLTELFFDTLNKKRDNDDYVSPNERIVKVPYLNGGLFDDSSEPKGYELLIIPNWVFLRLFEFLNQYNFTIDESSPEDHTVAVDPEMLGHIFENLLEDNKDKGAFYTPKEVVHYMCQESLIEYLTTHLSKSYTVYKELGQGQVALFGNDFKTGQLSFIESIGENSLNKGEIEFMVRQKDISQLTSEQLEAIDRLLDKVKVCDPAIGSGAFPMGLLQEIFAIKELIAYQNEIKWSPAKVKSNIIQNSIYGVDIEQGAVDIAQLRFWLSLIVDEDLPKPLPNLDFKIISGNSLITKFNDEVIEIDWDPDTTKTGHFGQNLIKERINRLEKLAKKQKLYFDANASEKEKLDKEIRLLTLQVLEKQLQLTIKTKGFEKDKNSIKKLTKKQSERLVETLIWKKTLSNIQALQKSKSDFDFFNWKLNFPEVLNPYLIEDKREVGFDIVIGNPPYIQIQKMDKVEKIALENINYVTYTRMGDIYCVFYEKGFNLLKENGTLSYITSNKWMRGGYGKVLRKYFSEINTQKILDLGPNIFPSATVATNIYIGKNEDFQNKVEGIAINDKSEISDLGDSDLLPINIEGEEAWLVLNKIELEIRNNFIKYGKPLKNWNLKINFGIKTGFNEAFIIPKGKRDQLIAIDERATEIIKPILKGREIERYYAAWDGDYVIATFPSLKLEIDNYSSVKEYLQSFQPKLNQVGETFINAKREKEKTRKKSGNKWFETQDPIGFVDEFEKEKIIWKRIGSIMRFSYSNKEIYCLDSTCIATGEKIKFLTAVLNSKAGLYQLAMTSPQTGTGDQIISVQALEPMLVPYPDNKTELPFTILVDYIIFLKSNKSKFQESELISLYLEQIIDGMVYELYFPELMQKNNRLIIEHLGELPKLSNNLNVDAKMKIITKVHERLNHKEHPVRNNLFYIKNIEEIKTIEGLD